MKVILLFVNTQSATLSYVEGLNYTYKASRNALKCFKVQEYKTFLLIVKEL